MTTETTTRPRWPNPTGEQILAFEYEHLIRPAPPGVKIQAILDAFGMTPTAYYQRLRAVALDDGVMIDPVTTRLVRERMARWAKQRRCAAG